LLATQTSAVAETAGVEWICADRFDEAALPAPIRRLLLGLDSVRTVT
jgi:hypothetical protein